MVTTFQLVTGGAIYKVGDYDAMSSASAQIPDGAYTTFRTYDGNCVLRLPQHLRRLEASVALMGKGEGQIDDAIARRAIADALCQMKYAESRFRLTYAPPDLFISVEPFAPYPAALYNAGAWCVSVSLHRDNPHAKSTVFIASAASAYKALPAGAQEGLMIADDGAVLEGLSSNFFTVVETRHGASLHTEEARVLVGVTRSLVLEVARGVIPISTDAVKYKELPDVSECFITSVSREIMPVVRIDQLVIGDGTPGPITRDLMHRFRDLVQREALPVA